MKNKDRTKNVMDKNPSKLEVIGRCGGDKNQMIMQNRQKSNAKIKISSLSSNLSSYLSSQRFF